jgi:hypothetical protein
MSERVAPAPPDDPPGDFSLDRAERDAVEGLARWIGYAGYALVVTTGIGLVVDLVAGVPIAGMNKAVAWCIRIITVLFMAGVGWWYVQIHRTFGADTSATDGSGLAVMPGLRALKRYFDVHKAVAYVFFGIIVAAIVVTGIVLVVAPR